jgi:hypothetical protein
VVAGSWDFTTLQWNVADLFSARDRAARIACTRTGGGLDPGEWSSYAGTLPYEDSCTAP